MSEALSLPILTPLSSERQFYQGVTLSDNEELTLLAQNQHRKPVYVLDSLSSNSRSFLYCAHAMAEQKRERGEMLPPNLMVVEAIQELKDRHPNILAGGNLPGITLEHDSSGGGTLTLTVREEYLSSEGILSQRWRVSAFGERVEDQRYEETRREPATDDFDQVITTRGRQLTMRDAYALQLLLQTEVPEVEPQEVELRLVPPIS